MPTLIEVVRKVREIAAERPDNRYVTRIGESCSYVKGLCTDGSEGCIFGQALRDLGFDTRSIPPHGGIECVLPDIVPVCRENSKEPLLLAWCSAVQWAQDHDQSWREAVQAGDEVCPFAVEIISNEDALAIQRAEAEGMVGNG